MEKSEIASGTVPESGLDRKVQGQTPNIHDVEKNVGRDTKPANEKNDITREYDEVFHDVRKQGHFGEGVVIDNAKDLVTHILHLDDNPNDSPWTFRAMLIGKSGVLVPDASLC